MDSPRDNPSVSYNLRYVWLISLVAAMGGLLFGYDWVVIGGAKPFFEQFFSLDERRRSGAGPTAAPCSAAWPGRSSPAG